MVERGGLDYPIRVRDEFSKTTQLFRKEINASKKEFRAFQKALSGGKSAASGTKARVKATKDQAKAQSDLTKVTKRSLKPMSDREKLARRTHATNKRLSKSIAILAKEQRARERTAIALRNAQNADIRREKSRLKTIERLAKAERKLAQSKDAEFQATKRNNAVLFRETIIRKQIEQLKSQAKAQFGSGDILGGTETLRRAKAMEKSLKGQVGSAQKLLFTFRRLVGALAIFTLARKGVQAFNALVKSGVQFNDTIATSQLGIAGLVVTLGDVRDEMGNSVSATEQLNLALGVAREQTAKLRQDSLKTVATFEQLLDTFQVSVGPGLAAGLDLDEVRKLTVDISQAASALGVPQNQLAEEVRSLLSGTIQARTTRIATALGISNEDVRRLKEAGTLFDVLEEKFSGFNEAAQRQARETFSGISTLIRGITQEILGQAAQPLFAELVTLGNQAFDSFLSVQDAAGNIRPSPEVVAAFQQVFDALKRSVEAMRELGQGTAIGALETAMATIAVTIDFVTGVVTELVRGFTFLRDIIADVAEFLGVTTENAGFAAQAMGSFVVKALFALKVLKLINVSMIRSAALIARWIAPFAVVIKALEFIFSKVTGVNLGLKDTIEIVAVSLFGAFADVSDGVRILSNNIVTFLENALDQVITAAKNKASGAASFLSSLFGDEEGSIRAEQERLARELASELRIAKRRKDSELEIAAIRAEAAARQIALEEELAKIVGERSGKNALGEGFDPRFSQDAVPGTGGISGPPTADGAGPAQVFGRARIDDATLKRVQEETILLEAQVSAELAKTAAITAGLNPSQTALVTARNSLSLAEAELEALKKKNELELAPLLAQREGLAPGAELDNLNEVIRALEKRQGFEEEILRLRTLQLDKAVEEVNLIANGSLNDGLKQGFADVANQFGTSFQAGIEIATASVQAFATAASQHITDALDPTKDAGTIKQRFATLLQEIAQIILQQLIELAIAKAIIEAGLGSDEGSVEEATQVGAVRISTETTIAGIRLANAIAIAAISNFAGGGEAGGLAKGGRVPEHFTRRAQGLAGGGFPRPNHIPSSDTIPAWLTPGEFVVNKKATSQFLPTLKAINGGNMPVVGSAGAEAAGPSSGMAAGGTVSDKIASSDSESGSGQGGTAVVVPAIVASEREMDLLTNGGRNAMFSFMREYAGNINALLNQGGGGR